MKNFHNNARRVCEAVDKRQREYAGICQLLGKEPPETAEKLEATAGIFNQFMGKSPRGIGARLNKLLAKAEAKEHRKTAGTKFHEHMQAAATHEDPERRASALAKAHAIHEDADNARLRKI